MPMPMKAPWDGGSSTASTTIQRCANADADADTKCTDIDVLGHTSLAGGGS